MNRNTIVLIIIGIILLTVLFFVFVYPKIKPCPTGQIRNPDTKKCEDKNKAFEGQVDNSGNPISIETIINEYEKAFNPEFWKVGAPPNTLLLTVDGARARAKRIYDAIGYVWDEESTIVKEIADLKTKSQISFVAYYFRDQTGEGMGDFILNHVDKADFFKQIVNHIINIPDYKL